MDANSTQAWYLSKGVWGAVAAVVCALAAVTWHVNLDPKDVVEVGLEAGTAIGGVLALYGRIVATKRIVSK